MTKKITGNDPTPRQFIESILPNYYEVTEVLTGTIRCISTKDEGIEDENEWEIFKSLARDYFGDSLKEFYHSTCTNHINFTVYYSYTKLYNLQPTEDGKHSLTGKTDKQ